MPDVEFCLKSMCFMPYTHIVVRESTGKGTNVLTYGTYDKVLSRYGTRKVISSDVSNDRLYITVSPTLTSCPDFACFKRDDCILQHCVGADCPICPSGLCSICSIRKSCKK